MTASHPDVDRVIDDTETARELAGSLTQDEFKALFRHHPGGVSVITAEANGRQVALTATSVASVSIDPPLLVFSVSEFSSAAEVLASADTVVVHLLDAQDLPLAKLASTSGVDRFANRALWSPLVTGEPVYHDARAWVRAAVIERLRAGGSTVYVVQALQSSINRTEEPAALVYHDRTWHQLGDHSAID